MKHDFDVIVVGGGHAGSEAALASHRMGARTLLITHSFAKIGEMSCNPAIGGLGKGHLVREIDALDGAMGRVADAAGIQFRLLNRRKGPAVQGPRTQADRHLYRMAMQREFLNHPELQVLEAEVSGFLRTKTGVAGVTLRDGSEVKARSVVLTAGTFLRGAIHIGHEARPGGRMGESPANALGKAIDAFNLPLGRLKTGTPPRLNGKTINWASLEMQEADEDPSFFSFLTESVSARQVACGITYTNAKTHDIIRENIGLSAMYGGQISGVGPRYCPSIEDKVVRFEEKDRHQVFLEPESLSDDVIYPNGISTSLPVDVQEAYVRSIEGLESVEILQPGYAIEYDYVDPRALDASLRVVDVDGLFFAGQINGTTGYEEAAAQGLLAGLNAALQAFDRDPLTLDRADGYIGVMIDDLVTRGVTEPYRMFTPRTEYRLSARADNADRRLTQLGIDLGCISDFRAKTFSEKSEDISKLTNAVKEATVTPNEAEKFGVSLRKDGVRRSAFELLSQADMTWDQISKIWPDTDFTSRYRDDVRYDARYASYVERQRAEVELLRRDESIELPKNMDFSAIQGLSQELREKLFATRPTNLGQASRIDGMTPAALSLVLMHAKKTEQKRA